MDQKPREFKLNFLEKNKKKVIIIFFIIVVLFIIGSLPRTRSGQSNESPITISPISNDQSKRQTLSSGEHGILNNNKDFSSCEGKTTVAITKDILNEATKAQINNDKIGWNYLAADGKIFFVNNCIPVQVIDRTFTLSQIRILEGQYYGISGWVPYEFAIQN